MTNIWQFLTIIAIGILAGYLFEKYATNQNINYMAFSIIFFSIIGTVVWIENTAYADHILSIVQSRNIVSFIEAR